MANSIKENEARMKGTLIVARIDGTKRFEEQTTRDKAVEQLELMKTCYPGHYTITGEHLLNGVIDLKFNSKGYLLNSISFKFIPDGLQQ
jgi:hypothetical protein